MGTVIIGILLFALATAFIYGWGLMKKRDEQKTLSAMLVGKCEKKIRKYLRQNDTISLKEAGTLLEGTAVSLFYSRKKLGVTDGKLFGGQLLTQMVHRGILSQKGDRYCLAKR